MIIVDAAERSHPLQRDWSNVSISETNINRSVAVKLLHSYTDLSTNILHTYTYTYINTHNKANIHAHTHTYPGSAHLN